MSPVLQRASWIWTISIAGMQPSDLILVAARPSMGKTAFVLNIAQHVAFKENYTVAIFSLEMSQGTAGKPSVFLGVQSGFPAVCVPVI